MRKNLLIPVLFLTLGSALTASAESKVYVFDYLGEVDGVADNGQYAAISDPDFGYAYLWRASDPDDLYDISELDEDTDLPNYMRPKATTAMDVSNDGVVVGSVLYRDNKSYPAYYKDGKWNLLPIEPDARNTNEAVCITPDGKVIAGYQFIRDASADQGARYYPCQWFLQPDGSYELKSYNNIEIPDHQGFWPMTQTPDGKVIGGTVYCGMGSRINALVKEGELILFDEIVTKMEPFTHYFKGVLKYYAGDEIDEDGKTRQVWVEDINDPRVKYFPEVYINGYHDGRNGSNEFLEGIFANCDDEGNFYGARNIVGAVDEEGVGEHYSDACIYNYLTDTWHIEEGVSLFTAGVGDSLLFTGDGEVIKGNDVNSVKDAFNVETEYIVNGIVKISRDGKTLGGVASELDQATGEYVYFPFIVQVDGGTSGTPELYGSPKKTLVIATAGRIEVVGAGNVAVYDLEGHLAGTGNVTEVPAGVYVVKADDDTYKIRVK